MNARGYILIAVLAVLVALAYLAGERRGARSAMGTVEERTDTLYIRDTVRVTEPVEVSHTVIREKLVEVPVYVSTRDTVIRTVYLPREERIYRDSSYMAVVSGVDPKLDYLEIFGSERQVTRTVIETRTLRARWSIGVQGGYGVALGDKVQLAPYIGIGLQYNIISFRPRQ